MENTSRICGDSEVPTKGQEASGPDRPNRLVVMLLSNGLVRIPVDKQGSPEGHITMLASEFAFLKQRAVIVDRMYQEDMGKSRLASTGFEIDRVTARYIGPSTLERNSGSRFLYWLRTVIFTTIFVRKALPVIQSVNPDVINTFAIYETLLVVVFAPSYRLRIVYNHHTSTYPSGGFIGTLMSNVAKTTVRMTGGVIALTPSDGKWFQDLGARNVEVIPPGVRIPSNLGACKPGSKFILFVGRISKEKGIDTLIHAFGLLHTKYGIKGIKLALVGPFEAAEKGPRGAYTESILRLVEELKLTSAISLTGYISANDLQSYYSRCDFFVLPSINETGSAASLEAMSYAKPVISTPTQSGLAQIIPGWNGFLVKKGDAEDLADKMNILLMNPQLVKLMGNNAREFAQKHDWKVVARAHLNYYKKLKQLSNRML